MEAHLLEWLNLAVRWVHMIVGIAWIGASFYFNWLENNLNRANPREGLAGDLWAIHGGGIYHLEKYKLAPPAMPENLHWFKWEAYSTWMSGVALLTVVYYLNPTLYLIAPGSGLTPGVAVVLGLGSLVVGWFFYDLLCESRLGQYPRLLAVTLFVLLVLAAWAFNQVFSGRGAYLHVGAIIGTIMVGNVFRVIMPAQRALLAAIAENRPPDPSLPGKGLLRSRHNNYFTLPVLFIMISNHFPSTYDSSWNWVILACLSVLAILVRHYFNTRHKSHKFAWTLPVAALGLLCLAYVTGPTSQPIPVAQAPIANKAVVVAAAPATVTSLPAATEPPPPTGNVSFEQVNAIIQQRCAVCHSATPTNSMFSVAPAGVMFDTPEQIHLLAPRIAAQAVAAQVMPLGNITRMTPQERDLIGAWINQGAVIH